MEGNPIPKVPYQANQLTKMKSLDSLSHWQTQGSQCNYFRRFPEFGIFLSVKPPGRSKDIAGVGGSRQMPWSPGKQTCPIVGPDLLQLPVHVWRGWLTWKEKAYSSTCIEVELVQYINKTAASPLVKPVLQESCIKQEFHECTRNLSIFFHIAEKPADGLVCSGWGCAAC